MSFISYEYTECIAEEHCVLWPAEHVFEHRVVGDKHIGNGPSRLCTSSAAAFIECGVVFFVSRCPIFRSLTGEMEQRDLILPGEPLVKSLDLVIDQRIHRIEDDRANARLARPALLTEQRIKDR